MNLIDIEVMEKGLINPVITFTVENNDHKSFEMIRGDYIYRLICNPISFTLIFKNKEKSKFYFSKDPEIAGSLKVKLRAIAEYSIGKGIGLKVAEYYSNIKESKIKQEEK